jgi:hypothetical protein
MTFQCVEKKPNGAPCSSDIECASTSCIAHVCVVGEPLGTAKACTIAP